MPRREINRWSSMAPMVKAGAEGGVRSRVTTPPIWRKDARARSRGRDQPRICLAGSEGRPRAPARALTCAHRMSRDRAAPATTRRGCRLRARSQRPAAVEQANAAPGPRSLAAANKIRWSVRPRETDIPGRETQIACAARDRGTEFGAEAGKERLIEDDAFKPCIGALR